MCVYLKWIKQCWQYYVIELRQRPGSANIQDWFDRKVIFLFGLPQESANLAVAENKKHCFRIYEFG